MTSPRIVQTVVILLGLVVLLGLGGVIWLVDHKVDPSGIALVSGITGTALGALGSLLATTRTGADPTTESLVEQASAAGAARVEADLRALDQGRTDLVTAVVAVVVLLIVLRVLRLI